MVNGQERAKINLSLFERWVEERYAANDWPAYVRGNKLNRNEIANECGFAKSVLLQNPSVRSSLEKLECKLRKSGLLSNEKRVSFEKCSTVIEEASIRRIKQRLNQVEQQNQLLMAENKTLKRKLKQFNLLDEYLNETGRVPR